MSWLGKVLPGIKQKKTQAEPTAVAIPKGLWHKCDTCSIQILQEDLQKSVYICPGCGRHERIDPQARITNFFDPDQEYQVLHQNIQPQNPLKFNDRESYKERLKKSQAGNNYKESLVVYQGMLYGKTCISTIFDFSFMGGSLGSVAGERFVRAAETAIALKCPFIVFCASGGARMQEGMFSLLQMTKTTAAINQLHHQKIPTISILTHPTTGGVAASFALICKLTIAEPGALIGFAGPRVIKQTVGVDLPADFQTSQFLLKHGMIDMICARNKLRKTIAHLIAILQKDYNYFQQIETNQS